MEEAGYEASAYATTPEPLSATKAREPAALAGFDLIVAAGGDGTVNEVVNGIAGLDHRPTVGIIPAGTTNDYARAFEDSALESVGCSRLHALTEMLIFVCNMDMGQSNGASFINIAAGGYM